MLLPGRLPPAALATLTSSALGTSAALLPSNHLVIDAVLPGLASASSTVAYVANVTGRYDPNEGDGVVGVVVDRFAEDCKVHLGPACSFPGVLNLLAFEGATRRNRPRINVGDVVYAVVTDAGRYEECSLACVHEADGKSHGLGVLAGAAGNASAVVAVSLGLARALLDAPPFQKGDGASGVLRALGKRVPFEVAVGTNGRVWISAATPDAVAAVAQALGACEGVAADKRVDAALAQLDRFGL